MTCELPPHVPARPPADMCKSARSRPGQPRKPGGRRRSVRREWTPPCPAPNSHVTEALKTKCAPPFFQSNSLGGKFCPEQTRGRPASVTPPRGPSRCPTRRPRRARLRGAPRRGRTNPRASASPASQCQVNAHTTGHFRSETTWPRVGGALRGGLVLGLNPPRPGRQTPGRKHDEERPRTRGQACNPRRGVDAAWSRDRRCQGDCSWPRALPTPTQRPSARAGASPMSPGRGNTGDVHQVSLAPDSG